MILVLAGACAGIGYVIGSGEPTSPPTAAAPPATRAGSTGAENEVNPWVSQTSNRIENATGDRPRLLVCPIIQRPGIFMSPSAGFNVLVHVQDFAAQSEVVAYVCAIYEDGLSVTCGSPSTYSTARIGTGTSSVSFDDGASQLLATLSGPATPDDPVYAFMTVEIGEPGEQWRSRVAGYRVCRGEGCHTLETGEPPTSPEP